MPEPLWIYLMALLYFTNITTCSAIADAFDSASHDQLTRMLQGPWSGHTLLDLALRACSRSLAGISSWMTRWWKTLMPGCWAKRPGSGRVSSAKSCSGSLSSCWSGPTGRSVFRWPFGSGKRGRLQVRPGPEVLSYARNRLRCKPQFVLFDSWYPSKKLLKRLRDYWVVLRLPTQEKSAFEGGPCSVRISSNPTGMRSARSPGG